MLQNCVNKRNVLVGILLPFAIISTALCSEEISDIERLFEAVQNKRPDKAQRIIELNPAVVNTRRCGWTPLHFAAKEGCLSTVKFLIEKGAGVNLQDEYCCTPLHYAAAGGFIVVVKLLLERGANSDVCSGGDQALHLLDRWLLFCHANTDPCSGEGRTALHLAIKNGHQGVAELLLRTGAQVDTQSQDGQTPLQLAIEKGYQGIAKLLVQRGAQVNRHGVYRLLPLHYAAGAGSLSIVKCLVQTGTDVNNAYNDLGYTPLHCAVSRGHVRVVQFLLKRNVAINARTGEGQTAVHTAHKFLMTWAHAFVPACIGEGQTALHLAIEYGYQDIAELLARNGAKVNVQDASGNTPLHLTSKQGHMGLTELLIQHGADVTLQNRHGQTPLHCAIESAQQDVVEVLVRNGVRCNTLDVFGKSPLHLVSEKGCTRIAECLVANGADVTLQNRNGQTPLHCAIESAQQDVVEVLVRNGADVNIPNRNGQTLLHLVRDLGSCQWLVQNGADVNARNNRGETPLHRPHELEVIKFLVRQGADVHAQDNRGRTPLYVAASRWGRSDALIKLFLEQGATIDKDIAKMLRGWISARDEAWRFFLAKAGKDCFEALEHREAGAVPQLPTDLNLFIISLLSDAWDRQTILKVKAEESSLNETKQLSRPLCACIVIGIVLKMMLTEAFGVQTVHDIYILALLGLIIEPVHKFFGTSSRESSAIILKKSRAYPRIHTVLKTIAPSDGARQ